MIKTASLWLAAAVITLACMPLLLVFGFIGCLIELVRGRV